jgi:trehalose 6-phosphate synthase/phosphatase
MKRPYDFIMAIGDDFTDEDMFKALPKRAFTIKVGLGKTRARYRVTNTKAVQILIASL